MEIIGYKLKNKINGYSTKVGSICYDKQYFDKYKNDLNFEPVYEAIETPKEVIPEYVEYIKSDDIGKIVKILKWSAASYCKVEFFDGTIKEPFKHLVKPSTKEAFLAQNQSKQPLKQAVHCKTQEEWDFVLSKFNPRGLAKNKFLDYKENSVIVTVDFDSNVGRFGHLIHHKHQILSFQEWCDLNGYKMENEIKSKCNPHNIKKGDYLYVLKDKYIGDILEVTGFYEEKEYNGIWIYHKNRSFSGGGFRADYKAYIYGKDYRLATDEEIDNFLSPKKVKSNQEFKTGDYVVITASCQNWNDSMNKYVGNIVRINSISSSKYIKFDGDGGWGWGYDDNHFRHATPEEINNHLISIGQISDLRIPNSTVEALHSLSSDYGLGSKSMTKPDHIEAMYMGRYATCADPFKKSNQKMILSIDDEELPMVSIVKTNSIKQLLNND